MDGWRCWYHGLLELIILMSRKKTSRTAKDTRVPAETQTISSRLAVFLASHRFPVGLAVIIVCAGLLAYANSMSGVFLFDDTPNIERNEHIRQLWPSVYLSHPGPRSLGMYTFAINYAIHGLDVWGYHVVNLAIHLSSGLLLFGVVRRTLRRDNLASRYGEAADGIAFAVALLWVVHPLQTQAVTYIVQRLESLMGLCYLGTLYCFIRAIDSRRSWPWYAASVLCVGLGAGVKEVIVTAPIVMVWYDRAFVSTSWRRLMHRRWGYYLAYILAAFPFVPRLVRWAFFASSGSMVGVGSEAPGMWEYLRSQPGVLLHYLRLCVWPTGQSLDYEWPVANGFWQIAGPGLLILGLLGLTTWCIFRHKEWSFLGGWFFLILAPTSSVVPFIDLAYEHRMYLPSIAVVTALVVSCHEALTALENRQKDWRIRALYPIALLTAAAILGGLTYSRNRLYHSEAAIWQDTVEKAPGNWRAHFNLSTSLAQDDHARREAHLRRSLDLAPDWSPAWTNLGILLKDTGRFRQSLECFDRAAELTPDDPDVYANAGPTWVLLGERERAVECYKKALSLAPNHALANGNLGSTLAEQGQYSEAVPLLAKAVKAAPGFRDARNNLGKAYVQLGEVERAIECFQENLDQNAEDYEAHYNIARALGASRPDLAVQHYVAALRLNPGFSQAHNNLAVFLERDQPERALHHYRMAIAAEPENLQAYLNLADLLERLGRHRDARDSYRAVLRVDPDCRKARDAVARLGASLANAHVSGGFGQ